MNKSFEQIFTPKSVAIVGASAKAGSVGNELIMRVLEAGYSGKLFAVNPKETQICGVPCYPSIKGVPVPVDLVIIAVPASAVFQVLKDCNEFNTKHAVIISSGFKEIGESGAKLETEIRDFADQNGMTVIGPNCLGVINTDASINLDASFAPLLPARGTIGFATQSGALASGIINILPSLNIGLAQMISLGNQCQVNALDIMEVWEKDPKIEQILLYLETIPDPVRFRQIATRISKTKPILVIKSGRSERGAKASVSHTGSLAGDDNTAKGLFAASGVIREYYLRDLFNSAQVLSKCNLPKGENLAILTNSGGPGILATDTANDFDIPISNLTDKTKDQLRAVLPPQASVNNPIDIIASATAEQYLKCAEILLKSIEVDMLLVIYLYITGKNDIKIMSGLNELKSKYPNKPIISVLMTTPDFDTEIEKAIPNNEVPYFKFIIDAIRGFKRLIERQSFLKNSKGTIPKFEVNKNDVENVINQAQNENIKQLSTIQSLNIFAAYDLPLPRFGVAQTLKDAKQIAANIGYPCVLKISSKTVTHKTDIGGVITNIKSEPELEFWWNRLVDRLNKAKIVESLDGIVVMQQIEGANRELVAGIVEKGGIHQMMFGMGGIFVEALKEVAFRPCPLTYNDAKELINATKAKNIMGFVRGGTAVDLKVVESTLLKLSQLVTDFPIIKEIDANPLMIDDKGHLYVVDARIVIE